MPWQGLGPVISLRTGNGAVTTSGPSIRLQSGSPGPGSGLNNVKITETFSERKSQKKMLFRKWNEEVHYVLRVLSVDELRSLINLTLMGVLIASLEIWYHFSARMLSANTILAALWEVNPYNKQMGDYPYPTRQYINLRKHIHVWERISSTISLKNGARGILGWQKAWHDLIGLASPASELARTRRKQEGAETREQRGEHPSSRVGRLALARPPHTRANMVNVHKVNMTRGQGQENGLYPLSVKNVCD